jgi:hypothetical protein
LRHFRPASCLGLTERASALLQQAPAGVERNALDIQIATLHDAAAFQLLGFGVEARTVLEPGYTQLN